MSHDEYRSVIEASFACATECSHCENACLDEENVSELVNCIRITGDCASICMLTAELLSGGSPFSDQVCGFCASICESCAEECGKHASMEHCRRCAEACRKCADECRTLSSVNELRVP